MSALSWVEEEGTARYVGGAGNRVVSSPIFFLPLPSLSSDPVSFSFFLSAITPPLPLLPPTIYT